MNFDSLKEILQGLYDKSIEPEEALKQLKQFPYENLGFARIDHHRNLRQGFPEVVYCEQKSVDQVVSIIDRICEKNHVALATRVTEEMVIEIRKKHPNAKHNPQARTVVIRDAEPKKVGRVLVATAGTSDIPVAEEVVVTADTMGSRVETVYDVGVAGIHRLFDQTQKLFEANVVVVVAGMDGALASVIGGMVEKPVIAVPTSVGYGASFGGISALLAMLNSCASGVAVVNIDNGFGAGMLAHKINRLGETKE